MLTLRLDATATAELKPLEVREWNTLARWLQAKGLAPEDLVQGDVDTVLDGWNNPRIDRDRLVRLLDRGHSLAVKMERWLSTGLWVIGRSDAGYPARLKQRLGEAAPPLLFGYGEQEHLHHGGLAIVGSRDATPEDMRLAENLGAVASHAGCAVVSGGARGIDQQAAHGAFLHGGTVVAILADSLLRTASRKENRDRLLNGAMTLMTPYGPEAGFSAGNAMGRNRLIYCLADAAVAVSSTPHKGGTFSGASEALEKGWVPVWTIPGTAPASGNDLLIEHGAGVLPPLDGLDVAQLFQQPAGTKKAPAAEQKSFLG
jgi:predicted Rossmann fold nucleotide-binding protein DprA/Smf involved in DNA uptake